MDMERHIIDQLNKAIDLYGISSAELARRAHIEPWSLSRSLRNARTLSAGELVRVSTVLGVTDLKAFLDEDQRREAADARQKMIDEFGSPINILGPGWGEGK